MEEPSRRRLSGRWRRPRIAQSFSHFPIRVAWSRLTRQRQMTGRMEKLSWQQEVHSLQPRCLIERIICKFRCLPSLCLHDLIPGFGTVSQSVTVGYFFLLSFSLGLMAIPDALIYPGLGF